MNWKPIETAPKVWASLLLAKSTYDGHFIEPVIGGWDDGAWRNRNGDHLEGQVVNITHWMPLPPPPSTEPAPQDTGEKWEQPEYDNDDHGNQWWSVGNSGKFRDEAEAMRATECWNLLAGHDLSQAVVLDKAVVEKLKDGLQYGCSTHDKFTREICREALASLNAGGADE